MVGTPVYLSPILWKAYVGKKEKADLKVKHDLEKSDIFSLGVSFLQLTLLLTNEIIGLNQEKIGPAAAEKLVGNIKNGRISYMLKRMLVYDENDRATYRELKEILAGRPRQAVSAPLNQIHFEEE